MKRLVAACLVIAAVSLGVHAEEQDDAPVHWQTSLSLRSGVRMGVMGEHVYAGTDTLSLLTWDLLPVFTMGASLEITTSEGTTLRSSIELPATRISGTMVDLDYEDATDRSVPTKRSDHTAVVESFRTLQVAIYQDLAEGADDFAVGLGYMDRFIRMNAFGGTYDYGSTAGDITGVAITYEQHHMVPYLSLAASVATTSRTTLVTRFSFAPFAWVDALDHHHRRLQDYHDFVVGALWFNAEIGVEFALAGRRVEVLAFGELIPETRGETYTVDYTSSTFEGTEGPIIPGGAGVSFWNLGLFVRVW